LTFPEIIEAAFPGLDDDECLRLAAILEHVVRTGAKGHANLQLCASRATPYLIARLYFNQLTRQPVEHDARTKEMMALRKLIKALR
jgi:hypothetical protein